MKLFLSKLRSRWSKPFKVLKVYPYGAVKINMEATGSFKVNGSQLKYYIIGELLKGKVTCALPDVTSS